MESMNSIEHTDKAVHNSDDSHSLSMSTSIDLDLKQPEPKNCLKKQQAFKSTKKVTSHIHLEAENSLPNSTTKIPSFLSSTNIKYHRSTCQKSPYSKQTQQQAFDDDEELPFQLNNLNNLYDISEKLQISLATDSSLFRTRSTNVGGNDEGGGGQKQQQQQKITTITILPFMASIQALEPESNLSPLDNSCSGATEIREGVDLICVVDHSGSMNDNQKLFLLKSTLLNLLTILSDKDRLCIIQFNNTSERVTPLLRTSKKNLPYFEEKIAEINAVGGTNINAGMACAFEVIKQRKFRNAVTSIFLLSDGLDPDADKRVKTTLDSFNFSDIFFPDDNKRNQQQLSPQLPQQKIQANLAMSGSCFNDTTSTIFTIETFGFGVDHDPKIMEKIAELCDGNFYFIEDVNKINECFLDAVAVLFSVVAQDIKLTIKTNKNFGQITKSFGSNCHYNTVLQQLEIYQRYLVSGVRHNFLFEVEVQSSSQELQRMQKGNIYCHSTEQLGNSVIPKSVGVVSDELLILQTMKCKEAQNGISPIQEEIKTSQIAYNSLMQDQGQYKVQDNELTKGLAKGDIFTVQDAIVNMEVVASTFKLKKQVKKQTELQIINQDDSQYQQLKNNLFKDDGLQVQQEVRENYMRVTSAEALSCCIQLAEEGKYIQGVNLLEDQLYKIQQFNLQDSLKSLVQNLQDAIAACQPKNFQNLGLHKMISFKRRHMEQRSDGTDNCYQNNLQKAFQNSYQLSKKGLLSPNQ